jgi:hypothetical protein
VTPPLSLSRRRAVALLLSWSLVLLVLLTLQTGAPFTLLEPLSVEQGVGLALFLVTSVFWVPRWRRGGTVHAHLAVVLLVLVLHPLTTPLGRDGTFAVAALHAGLVTAWLTRWRPERKLLLLALIVGLALVETILSALPEGPRPAMEGLADYGDLMGPYGEGGFLLPDLDRSVVGSQGPVEWVTNREGFRNREATPRAKPARRARLIIVGDSFVTGYRTDQERTVGRVLERRLRERSSPRPLEVLVAGAGHPRAAREWLARHGLAFDPDLVVLGLTLGNDPAQSWLAHRGLQVPLLDSLLLPGDSYPGRALDLLPVKLDRTLRSWRVYRRTRRLFATEVISSWFLDFPTRVHLFDPGHALGLFYSRQAIPLVEQASEDLIHELAAIRDECAQRRVPFLVMIIPQRFQTTDREWRATAFEYGLDPEAFDVERPNRGLLAGCAAHQLWCLDLLPGFRAAGAAPLYQGLGDMHWNDAGHALAAGLLAEEIEDRHQPLVRAGPE